MSKTVTFTFDLLRDGNADELKEHVTAFIQRAIEYKFPVDNGMPSNLAGNAFTAIGNSVKTFNVVVKLPPKPIAKPRYDTFYNEGFETGKYWPDAWDHKPGGPWVPSAGYSESSKQIHEHAVEQRKEWLRGWEDGMQDKLSSRRKNPYRSVSENKVLHNEKH